MPYDFVIISVSPAKPKPLGLSRGELIRKLFPDIETYVAGEKRRRELTTDHWTRACWRSTSTTPTRRCTAR